MKRLVLFAAAALTFAGAGAQERSSEGDRILGLYEVIGETTGEKSNVRFFKEADQYQARIVWLDNPTNPDGSPRLDDQNPDPELAKVHADKILLVWNLRYDGKKKMWTGGKIYNPVGGKTYDTQMEFQTPDQLKVRGYIGRPMMGKNYFWKRIGD